MNVTFTDEGWDDYLEWFKAGDKKSIKKINELVEDIKKNGLFVGIGKPEKLKYLDEDLYSRRISQGDRLIYCQDDTRGLIIVSCRGHYGDK